jgi:hypothetical protein
MVSFPVAIELFMEVVTVQSFVCRTSDRID